MITIRLDWPARELSPNARVHWRAKSEIVKYHRAIARLEALKFEGWTYPRVDLAVNFYPPDKLHRDLDNAYSSIKSYQDGIFDALGMNDSCINLVELRWAGVRKGGMVEITLMEAE